MSNLETLAELDRRIAIVEANLKTLRDEASILDVVNPAVARLCGIIEVGARSLDGMRARREALERAASS
jgi:hypothetical protein